MLALSISPMPKECLLLPLSANGARSATNTIKKLLDELGCEPQKIARTDFEPQHLHRSDVILVEVDSINDLELFRVLRQGTRKPIIMYGSAVSTTIWVRGLEYGADGFINLPEPHEVLRERLRAILHRSGIPV